jgi:outer membrane biosynthesis protein TonB
MSDVFAIGNKSAVALCIAVGFPNADKYNATRLRQRIKSIDQVATEEVQAAIEDPAMKKQLANLLAAIEAGNVIEVVSEDKADPVVAPVKEKKVKKVNKVKKVKKVEKESPVRSVAPAKKGKKKSATLKNAEAVMDKPVKEKKVKAPKEAKAPGVIATIAASLMKASAKKPIGKSAILEVLKEAFPDREAFSMMNTIQHNVTPGPMDRTGHVIVKTDGGYYIEK